jgi:hypothetical protein
MDQIETEVNYCLPLPVPVPEELVEPPLCELPDPAVLDSLDADDAGVVLTGCIAGIGAPFFSKPPDTACILGT